MPLVLDASATVAWFLPDEFDDEAEMLLDFVVTHGALVPALWMVEIQNALRNALRRDRVTMERAEAILDRLARLPLRVVDLEDHPAFHRAFTIALAHELSVYDAVYVDAALRHHAHLVSRDARVRSVAENLGIRTTIPGQ